MKKWMALLLACLLCLCAAGTMAEGAVTIEFRSDNGWVYDIYPNGYVKSKGGSEAQFFAHEGPYIFKGDKMNQDTPLDFHANAYDETTGKVKTENGQHVSYDVTFQDLQLYYGLGCTIIRFGCNEEPAQDCSITLKLRLSGTSDLTSYAYSVFRYAFSDQSSAVKICVQPSDGSMKLNCGAPVDGNSVLYANGQTITSENAASYRDMKVYADQSSSTDLIRRAGRPATYTEDGMKEYWECPTCGTLYADAAGRIVTTLDELTLPKLVRTDDLPQTGDSSSLLGWAALLGACCAGLWFVNRRRG
ncbi:MAG: LPXTG cell wall anchor domain-containing protein [Candidatus Ventricola sp.]